MVVLGKYSINVFLLSDSQHDNKKNKELFFVRTLSEHQSMCSTPFHVIFNEFEIIIIFILLSLNCPNDIVYSDFWAFARGDQCINNAIYLLWHLLLLQRCHILYIHNLVTNTQFELFNFFFLFTRLKFLHKWIIK